MKMSSQSMPAPKKRKVEEPDDSAEVVEVEAIKGDVEESLDPESEELLGRSVTQSLLEEADTCQGKLDSLNEQASQEILNVEQKYSKLRKPHFDKRNDLIRQIPNFWVTAFVNHPQISVILTEEEEECLHYLDKVNVEDFDDIRSGYKISFHFITNPYFHNDLLCKEFHNAYTDGHVTETMSTSVPVQWKDEEVDLTKSIPQDSSTMRRRRSGLVQTFFSWYLDNLDPHMDDIAEVIKEDLWPNPLSYYLASDQDVEENGVDSEDECAEDEDEVVIGTDDEDEQNQGEEHSVEEVLIDDDSSRRDDQTGHAQ